MDAQKETFEPLAVAAPRLGVPASWLKAEAIAERLPALRVGKRLLFNVEQVERALLEKAEAKHAYTLAEVAELYRCSHSSVLSLVQSGALQAIDVSTNPTGRSRYIVTSESLEAFELRRTVTPPSPPAKRRAKVRRGDVIEFI